MLDNTVDRAAVELVNEFGRRLSSPAQKIHALDDPDEWLREPAYAAPAEIDIIQAQKEIDAMMGTTRNGESIYKLVWNGDKNFWYQFFMEWDGSGQPSAPVTLRPRVRYKALRDPVTRKLIRDVFPPRWLVLTRIEKEQYAETWARESWVWAHEINAPKLIRPDEPPPVFWVHFATIGTHSNYCCRTKEKNQELCFGEYAPPRALYPVLGEQKRADAAAGNLSPFEKVNPSFISELEDLQTGYRLELEELQVEARIALANPMAAIGIEASMRAGIDTPAQAEKFIKEFYDRQIQEQAKLI